jgi:hypothetical protein
MIDKIAIVTLRQEFHDDIKNEPKGGGRAKQVFTLPFKKGYCVAIGRNPFLHWGDEVIYTPSQWITRHIGHLRCLESGGGLIYILDIEVREEKIKIFDHRTMEQVKRQHKFSNGDCLKLDGVPVFLEYVEKSTGDDIDNCKETSW